MWFEFIFDKWRPIDIQSLGTVISAFGLHKLLLIPAEERIERFSYKCCSLLRSGHHDCCTFNSCRILQALHVLWTVLDRVCAVTICSTQWAGIGSEYRAGDFAISILEIVWCVKTLTFTVVATENTHLKQNMNTVAQSSISLQVLCKSVMLFTHIEQLSKGLIQVSPTLEYTVECTLAQLNEQTYLWLLGWLYSW